MKNNKGFTLMELMIVVAIIGVLIAIAIPSFGNKLENSREVADVANLRAAYSQAMTEHLLGETVGDSVTVSGVRLSSTGSLDYADAGDLSFSLPEGFSFSKGTYTATFDFSTVRPSVALALKSSD